MKDYGHEFNVEQIDWNFDNDKEDGPKPMDGLTGVPPYFLPRSQGHNINTPKGCLPILNTFPGKRHLRHFNPIFSEFLKRFFAFQRDTMQEPLVTVIIIDRVMLGATIIPKSHSTRRPDKATAIFRFDLVLE